MTKKLALTPALLIFACLVAAFYGALHNQISYTVAPEYFTKFKFHQFGIYFESDRLGAALVGAFASWWMGLLIGIPIALVALLSPDWRVYRRTFIRSALVVVAVTLLSGIGALLFAIATLGPDDLPAWAVRNELTDPLAFARAGTMHNFSYLGGLIGLIFGLIFAWRTSRSKQG